MKTIHAAFLVLAIGSFSTALHAEVGEQGINVQGINVQGINVQGINVQGINVQGINVQGINVQGINVQGINVQGINVQGINVQGINVQGSEILSLGLKESELEITIYVGQKDGVHVWLELKGSGLFVHSYSRSGGFQTELIRRSASFVFTTPGQRGGVNVFRLSHRGWDTTTNSMAGRGRIAASNGSNSDVALYRLELETSGGWSNVCSENRDVVLLKGSWTDGVYSSVGVSFSCSGIGVGAKCIQQWGYKPWRSAFYGPLEVPLQPLFQSCVRAAMADYCGDGITHTEANTIVDIYDFYGFNVPATNADVLEVQQSEPDWVPVLESVLGEDGTVAHHQERYSVNGLNLYCDGTLYPTHPDEEALWDDILNNLMPWQSAEQYGMDWPYIAVRSSPVTWEFPFTPILSTLICPSEFEGCEG